MLRQMREKLKMSYLSSSVSVLFFLLLLDTRTILADYENTFSSYYEQPCCNGPHHLRHHKGKKMAFSSFKLINTFSTVHLLLFILLFYFHRSHAIVSWWDGRRWKAEMNIHLHTDYKAEFSHGCRSTKNYKKNIQKFLSF